MTGINEEKAELGRRLFDARDAAGLTQPTVAVLLANAGYAVTKQAVSAWEKGRNVPDALVLKHLARLYDTTTDALLGLRSHSADAERLAVVFDSLSDQQRAGFLDVCGPFLEKHTRNVDVFASVHTNEEMTPEQRRIADANERAMARRPTRRTRAA